MHNPNPLEKLQGRIESESNFSNEQVSEFKDIVSEYYYQITYGSEEIKLDSIHVEDFNNIIEADFSPGGKSRAVYGQNSEGKTSLLKAIQFNLLGLPEDRAHYGMTHLIRRDGNVINTAGNWLIDNKTVPLQRQMIARGRGGKLKRHEEPTLGKENGKFPQDRHNQPSEVFDRFGLLPLVNRGYGPYEVMSLFFLMSRDFLDFLDNSQSSQIIDILFGINLTNVLNAVEQQRKSEVEITESMARAPTKLKEVRKEIEQKKEQISNLEENRSYLYSEMKNKTEDLESIQGADDAESLLNELRFKRSKQQSKLADRKIELSNATSELAKTKRLIERHEDTELLDDVGGVGEELQRLMTVPDRCPVCTHSVDGDSKKRMLNHGECPLCRKDVPEKRMRIEREYQPDDTLMEQREEQREELENLRDEKSKLETRINHLNRDIKLIKDDLERVNRQISEKNLTEVLDKQSDLEDELENLRQKAIETVVKIERNENELAELKYIQKGNKHLQDLLEARKDRKQALNRLQGIVKSVRDEERSLLKSQLEEEMQKVLEYFNTGIFSGAHSVSIEKGDTYHFRVGSSERTFRSSQAEPEAAEATLHALLFHTATLKHLSDMEGSLPMRMMVIDSPFANEMSSSNRLDVSQILAELPDYLEDYQIIIAIADPDYTERELLEDSPLQLKKFEARTTAEDIEDSTIESGSVEEQSTLVSDDTDEKGVA